MKTKGLIVESIEKWGVKLTHDQAYRAKTRTIEINQGTRSEQYKHLKSYAECRGVEEVKSKKMCVCV